MNLALPTFRSRRWVAIRWPWSLVFPLVVLAGTLLMAASVYLGTQARGDAYATFQIGMFMAVVGFWLGDAEVDMLGEKPAPGKQRIGFAIKALQVMQVPLFFARMVQMAWF